MFKQTKYDNPKFWVAEQLGFDNWPKPEKPHKNEGRPLASVYQTWSTEAYLPYIYYSMMSQLLYTDVEEKADIYLFVDEERYDFAVHLFRHMLDSSCIIKLSRMMAVKYMVTCHPILHKYKAVAVIDSDMFFYADTKIDFYAALEKRYETNDDILLIDSGVSSKEVFWSRHQDLNKNVPKEDYLDYFVRETRIDKQELENWVDSTDWLVSCIFCYNPKTYINPKYYQYAITCAYNEFYCDETVWMVWAKARQVPIKSIRHEMNDTVRIWLDFMGMSLDPYLKHRKGETEMFLSLVHPLSGPGRINPTCLDLLRKIELQFTEKYPQ